MSTLKQRAYSYIRSAMATGTLAAGDRLSPAALAKELGISHIPVREAISQLHSEGLAEQCPGRGAFVRQLRRQELIELIELRKVLECNAAAQAARRATDAATDELEEHLRRMHDVYVQLRDSKARTDEERFPLLCDWLFADLAFHMAILQMAGNQCVIKAMNEANVMTRMFAQRTDVPGVWANSVFTANNYAVHRELFVAIRRHDPKAARRAMAVHMNRARRNSLRRFDWVHEHGIADGAHGREFPESVRREIMDIQRRQWETMRPLEEETER
jgi:DNA-binding GntR family transcriptional regulator